MLLAIGAGLVSSLVAQPSAGLGHELRFRFQPGDKFYLYLVSVAKQMTTQVASPGAPGRITEQTIRLGCDLDIKEVEEDGCAWAKYTYRQVAMKIEGPGVSIDFDSDANQPKVPLQVLPLAMAVGEGFYVKITPQGRIDKINGLQAIISSAKAKVPGVAGRSQILQTIDNQFGEAVTRRDIEDQLAVFPDPCMRSRLGEDTAGAAEEIEMPSRSRAVEPGQEPQTAVDTWSRIERIDEEKIVVERTFRLKGRRPAPVLEPNAQPSSKVAVTDQISEFDSIPQSQNWCWVIDVNIVVRPAADVKETVRGGVRMRREVSGRGAGQIEIDESTGRIINSQTTKDLVEEIKFSSEGPVRRIPPVPEPARTHVVTAFRMIKRESGKPPASPPPDGTVESEPNQP